MNDTTRIGWMCATDYYHELGEGTGSTPIYPSLFSLKENRKCVEQCGIVKVKIVLDETIQTPDYSWRNK